jgi:cell pole-organizing protein PopZ
MLLSAPEPGPEPAWEAAYEPVTAAAPEPEPVIYTAAPAPAPLPEPEPVLFMAPAAPVAAPPEIMEPAPMPAAAAPTETSLLDDKLANVISDSIGSMMRSATAERSVGVGRSGVTLEDIVREEMKPVLKAWLETNLPDMVERVVRAEIERVVARIKA